MAPRTIMNGFGTAVGAATGHGLAVELCKFVLVGFIVATNAQQNIERFTIIAKRNNSSPRHSKNIANSLADLEGRFFLQTLNLF